MADAEIPVVNELDPGADPGAAPGTVTQSTVAPAVDVVVAVAAEVHNSEPGH